MLTEFGIHHRLESCEKHNYCRVVPLTPYCCCRILVRTYLLFSPGGLVKLLSRLTRPGLPKGPMDPQRLLVGARVMITTASPSRQ